jgi:hypothetical protein
MVSNELSLLMRIADGPGCSIPPSAAETLMRLLRLKLATLTERGVELDEGGIEVVVYETPIPACVREAIERARQSGSPSQ